MTIILSQCLLALPTHGDPPTPLHRHPPGLYVLFFTEMWERYSFYSMMAILVAVHERGAALRRRRASGSVYGVYQAGVYLLPIAGGLLADRLLGFSRASSSAAC